MKKLNIQSFNSLVFGGGYGLTLSEVVIKQMDVRNFVRNENAKLGLTVPDESKNGSTINITANVKLAYKAGYNVYLTLLFIGQDYDHHIINTAELIKLIANGEFEIEKNGNAGAHIIEWLTTDAKEAIKGLSPYLAETNFDENFIYLQDSSNIRNFMMDYQEGLGLDGGRMPALFEDSLRKELDSKFREEAIKLLSK